MKIRVFGQSGGGVTGGRPGSRIPDYCMGRVSDVNSKEWIIQECDAVFHPSVVQRDDFNSLFRKIDAFGEFIAAYDSQILGFIVFYANDQRDGGAYITLLAVKTAYQGRHIGQRLLNECKAFSRRRGMKLLKLEVNRDNAQAILFYERNGFHFTKRYTDSGVYMEMELL